MSSFKSESLAACEFNAGFVFHKESSSFSGGRVRVRRSLSTGQRPLPTLRRRRGSAQTSVLARLLLTDAEFLNNVFVSLGVVLLEVVEQATPLADQHEKAAAGTMVLLVGLEVLRKLTDALAQNSDLHFGAARVRTVDSVLLDNALFLISR